MAAVSKSGKPGWKGGTGFQYVMCSDRKIEGLEACATE